MRVPDSQQTYGCIVIILCLFLAGSACETKLESSWQENPYFSYREITLGNGSILHFALILPENPDLSQVYPVLLAFPPGTQDYEMAEWAIEKYWIRASIRNNWIVISPIASGGTSFYEGGETAIPELMDWAEANFNVEGGRFHCAGMSAGGFSAFRIAIDYPDRVHSVMAFPGYPTDPEDENRLDRLVDIPVVMYVGQLDTDWVETMDTFHDQMTAAGVDAIFTVLPLEEHVIQGLSPESLFQILDTFR
jgi:pimeloyl-ACP methyl ester carboxylesterase